MQNSMLMFTFSVFDWKYFLEKFGPKNQNCQFELKFEYAELCRKYVVFTSSVLDQKNTFWTSLVKKFGIVS